MILPNNKLPQVDLIMRNPTSDSHLDEEESAAPNSLRIRKMYWAALSSLLFAFTMGLAVGYSAPATYDMTTRLTSTVKPNKYDVTWIGSVLALGAMSGGILAGPAADKLGRQSILIYNTVPFVIGWLLICLAKSVAAMVFGRLICGLSCGILSVAVPMYCVEISTPEVRGLLGSSFQGFIVIGNLMSGIIGSYIAWNYLALTGAASATVAMLCFVTMPESPRWLIARGRMKAAVLSMHNLQGGSLVDTEEECNRIQNEMTSQRKGLLTFKECKDPTVYKPALIASALMFFQQFSGANAVLFYSSAIFHDARNFMDPKQSTIILGSVQVVATLFSNLIVDKAGRKLLLLVSGGLMSVSLTVLGIYYYQSSNHTGFQEQYNWIPLMSLVSFLIAFSLGYGAIPWLLAAEMVPMRARSTIGGLATFSNGIFAFVVTKTFSEVQDVLHNYGTFWTYGMLSVLSMVFVSFMVPETKGKSLDEIAKHFSKKKDRGNTTEISIIYK